MFCFVSGGSSSSGYYPPAHLGQVSNEAMALLRLSMLLLPSAAVALSSRMILGVVEIKWCEQTYPPPPKSKIDTKKDGFLHVSPFKYCHFWYPCFVFGGVGVQAGRRKHIQQRLGETYANPKACEKEMEKNPPWMNGDSCFCCMYL